jgi:hypothetical protein
VSLLTILFSGAADGFENPLANYMADQLVSHQYVPYYPSTIDYTEPNLFIGGILQSSPNADVTDQKWKDFAYQSQTAAAHPPAELRGMQGAAAWLIKI